MRFHTRRKKESIEEILKLVNLKKVSRGQSLKGLKKLIVFGCLAKRYKNDLIKEIPDIDAIFGVGEDERIVEYCKVCRFTPLEFISKRGSPFIHSPIHPFASYAYLKIAEGCSRECAYCVIPLNQRRIKNITPDEILKKAGI